LSSVNAHLQDQFDINLTPTSIVDAMLLDEIPKEIRLLLADLAAFSSRSAAEVS